MTLLRTSEDALCQQLTNEVSGLPLFISPGDLEWGERAGKWWGQRKGETEKERAREKVGREGVREEKEGNGKRVEMFLE